VRSGGGGELGGLFEADVSDKDKFITPSSGHSGGHQPPSVQKLIEETGLLHR